METMTDARDIGFDARADDDAFEKAVIDELNWLRVGREARRRFDREEQGEPPELDIIALDEDLQGDEDQTFRVADLMSSHGNTIIVGLRKLGKTTLMVNLARCLKTGDPFLGRFAVQPVDGRVAILNYEMPRGRMRRWCREAGCPDDGVLLVNLRGVRNPLDYEVGREVLADRLTELDVRALIVDPFMAAARSIESISNSEADRWLRDLEEFVRCRTPVEDLIINVHAGWTNTDRSRGASAIEGWPDNILILTADEKDDRRRYFSARGRDVDLRKHQLLYDKTTRRVTIGATDDRAGRANLKARMRRAAKVAMLVEVVVSLITAKPGQLNGVQLRDGLKEHAVVNSLPCPQTYSHANVTEAIRMAVDADRIWVDVGGAGKQNLHWPGPDPNLVRSPPDLTRPDQVVP